MASLEKRNDFVDLAGIPILPEVIKRRGEVRYIPHKGSKKRRSKVINLLFTGEGVVEEPVVDPEKLLSEINNLERFNRKRKFAKRETI